MQKLFAGQETLDENYEILSRTTWAGEHTPRVDWSREGDIAVGHFACGIDAHTFLRVHLRPETFLDVTPYNHQDLPRGGPENGQATIRIPLGTLNTAALRNIIDAEPENQNTISQNNEKYDLLTQLQWSGVFTPEIKWRREGQNAVGTFGFCEDASGFIFGYLEERRGNCFLAIETEDSIKQRGRVRETFLDKASMIDQVQMPERKPWGVPVEVKIPLRVLNAVGLKQKVQQETMYFARRDAAEGQATPAAFPKLDNE